MRASSDAPETSRPESHPYDARGRFAAWGPGGAVTHNIAVGDLVVVDDVIDQTRQRAGTFFQDSPLGFLRQFPVFCPTLRHPPLHRQAGKLASLNRSWQSKVGTYHSLEMVGIEPTLSKSNCNWTPLSAAAARR